MSADYNPAEYVTVPDGWTCKRLADCTIDGNISYGIVQPGKHDDNGIPIIRVNNVNNGNLNLSEVLKVSTEVEAKFQRTRLKGGEVLLTLVGSTGQSFVAPEELCGWNVPRAIAVIRTEESVGAEWVNICLQSNEAKYFLNVRANTTVQKTLNLKDVRDIPILIPPKATKAFIEKTALSISQKIKLNHQTNHTLENLAQAIFKSWFVDFDPTRAKISAKEKGQDPELAAMAAIAGKSIDELDTLSDEQLENLKHTAALFPDKLVESELGEIPEGWSVGSVGDIALAKGGYAFKGKSFVDEGHPVVKIKNITGDGRVDLTGAVCINDEQASSSKRFKLNDGDLLMAMTGATVGKIGFVTTGGKAVYLNQRVAKFESEKFERKISWFLFCCFGRSSIFDSVVGAAQGSAQPNISSSGIEATQLVMPSHQLIEEFCNKSDSLFRKWLCNIDENADLEQIRDTLLPKLLTGEIDVQMDL